jgi:hypothetical protein
MINYITKQNKVKQFIETKNITYRNISKNENFKLKKNLKFE